MSAPSTGLPYADRLRNVSVVSAALVVPRSATSWFTVPVFLMPASGTHGDCDGVITVVLAIATGAGLLLIPCRRLNATACGLRILDVDTYEVVCITELFQINVGWGLAP